MRRLLTALLFWPLAAFGTPYYIDLDAGNDGAAGTSTGTAWLTVGKFLTTAVAGDIGYVRAATSEVIAATVTATNSGTSSALITLIGCDSVVNDPWGDASDVLPLIDFNGAILYINVYRLEGWQFNRLRFLNSHATNGPLQLNASQGCIIDSCTFENNYKWGLGAIYSVASILNCTFTNNGDAGSAQGSVATSYSALYFYNCTFDPYGTNIHIFGGVGKNIICEKCTLTACSYVLEDSYGSISLALFRNCSFGAMTGFTTADAGWYCRRLVQPIYVDGWDFDGTAFQKGHQWQFQYSGEIDSWTTYARSGGCTQGWRFQANSKCTADAPLMLTHFVYVDDTDAHNYSMWCKFQADAFDKGADLDETEIGFYITELKGDGTSPQTAMGATTWDFDNTTTWQQGAATSFTASAAGTLRIDVFVASASGDVYIDPPVGEAGAGNEGYADGTVYYNIGNVGGGGGSVRLVGGVRAR